MGKIIVILGIDMHKNIIKAEFQTRLMIYRPSSFHFLHRPLL